MSKYASVSKVLDNLLVHALSLLTKDLSVTSHLKSEVSIIVLIRRKDLAFAIVRC